MRLLIPVAQFNESKGEKLRSLGSSVSHRLNYYSLAQDYPTALVMTDIDVGEAIRSATRFDNDSMLFITRQ
jgi:hypothetical protein